MATILLQAAGAFLGGFLGPVGDARQGGGRRLPATWSTARWSARRNISRARGCRGQRLFFRPRRGASIPRVYGTARVAGNLIWATRFEEEARSTRRGFKGRAAYDDLPLLCQCRLRASCEGEIAGVRRIWVGRARASWIPETVTIRIHRGGQDQPVDPLIAAKAGRGQRRPPIAGSPMRSSKGCRWTSTATASRSSISR